jgi:uncharacterized protein YdhG (YjbR/CyaY superfamily)
MKKSSSKTSVKKRTPAKNIDDYLAALPENARATLEKLRHAIKEAIPEAEEGISYQMPAFKYKKRPLVAFAAFRDHCSFYPMSPAVMEAHKEELEGYDISKGTIRFPIGESLPATLVRKLVQARLAENEAGGRKYGKK